MKVIVQTVNGTISEYEIKKTDTILSLKEKIGKDQGLSSEKMRLFLRKKSTGIFSYFLGGETIYLKNETLTLNDINFQEGDFFFFTIKMGNDEDIKDNQQVFILNGEKKTFDSHEILNLNYAQFKHKFNIPENEDVEFSYNYNVFKDEYPSISYRKFNKNMNDISNGEIKCIVKMNDEEIEVGLPKMAQVKDLKLKLFNYFDELKEKPFEIIQLEDEYTPIFNEYTLIKYSPGKIWKLGVEFN